MEGDYIGVADGLGMSMGDGGEGNKRSVVMSGGGDACVGSRRVSERDCCRLPGVIRELWKDLQYSFSFFIDLFLNKVVTLVGMERRR